MARLRFRILFDGDHSLGPGKVQLLEAVAEHGSISAAARSLGMAYRHAWEMIDDLNQCFAEPVVRTETGGRAGGGSELTPFGRELVKRFHDMDTRVRRSLAGDLEALEAARKPPGRRTARKPGS